jgi:hypothetical protein
MIRLAIGVPLVAIFPALSGCSPALHEQTVSFTAPHMQGSSVDVKARNGAITVTQKPGDVVDIVAKLRMVSQDRIAQTSITATRDANQVLIIRAEPPTGGFKSRESVSFDITIPEAQGVKVATSNGRISIIGLRGEADLHTSNGAIDIKNHSGPVKARSSNGRISASDIAGPINAQTSNGAISIVLTDDNPGPAQVRTSNGAVSLQVGSGFAGDLDIRTSNGSIKVPDKRETPAPFEIMTFSRRSAALRFNAEAAPAQNSTIQTSNGSVSVKVTNKSS